MITNWYYFKYLLCAILLICCAQISHASDDALTVISSSDPDSKAAQSFVVVPMGSRIPEGIKSKAKGSMLSFQIPFIINLNNKADDNLSLQWTITVPNIKLGTIQVLSKFPGKRKIKSNTTIWQSDILDHSTTERNRLVFRPLPHHHRSAIYKKGKGRNGHRTQYGGGTRNIDQQHYNPRLRYEVKLTLLNDGITEKTYRTVIEMDNKDMIRQEYINHYNIKRYGRGGNGLLPVPTRNEISSLPVNYRNISGSPLTESHYKLLVNDGMNELAKNISRLYEAKKDYYRKFPLFNIKGKPLKTPNSQLWLSGGWRNPERNEWFSHALNGIHQRGGAIDIVIRAPPGHPDTAIAYWILWNSLKDNKDHIDAFWQLETNGRPMRTDEFKNDIEPKNGIPDAFDKADHLHANIIYN